MNSALSIRIRGVVQGVGFRPFVYRLAHELGITGWVLNGEEGVAIHAEGEEKTLWRFTEELRLQAPAAAVISEIEVEAAALTGLTAFAIR
jgi:hydrogenase maturation protein HypF